MLRELHVLHLDLATHELPAPLAAAVAGDQVLVMHTCQRTVVLAADGSAIRALNTALGTDAPTTHYQNVAAYEFMLKLSCGLQSRLAGETEIFGQIKQCWQQFSRRDIALAQQLHGTMQRLFRDVKELRSQYLSGIGSASYGSLVRRLLDAGDAGAGLSRPVLLLGAGQIANAVAPWIEGSELWLWNRSADKAGELAVELQRRSPERVIKVLDASSEAELTGWRSAADVVVCIPADAERDAARATAWAAPRQVRGRLIHLGLDSSAQMAEWRDATGMLDLAAVYELLRASNEQRRLQLERARAACASMAADWSPWRESTPSRKRSQQVAANRLNS
jgi:glutamyl-tRNA reductase